MTVGATETFYLHTSGEPVYALFDRAPRPIESNATRQAGDAHGEASSASSASGLTQGVGVLLCPLFGNDDLCAYRARREWAKVLAADGHPTLRIDLPGSGDSFGGPYDSRLLPAWLDALSAAAAWLRGEGRCARVCAIGMGFGGVLAMHTTAAGAAIDDLVLWGVPARGRTLVRQMRVLSHMEASRATASEQAATSMPAGGLASAGFVMSAETLAALEEIELHTLELSQPTTRRVLLLERDGIAIDDKLHAALERAGVQVTVSPGPGYGAMVAPPQQSRAPVEVFASVGEWLADAPALPATASPHAAPATADAIELELNGVRIREQPFTVASGEGRLTGVLTSSSHEARLCAVLLNAGALRHIGPNRMWVELARRWAARGVPTLRIDLGGIGDADGDALALARDETFYVARYVAQTHEVLAELAERGLPERYVLMGLCSGAYWAFHAALEDQRVRGAFAVNPRALFWDWSVEGVREARNVRKTLRLVTWRKLARGEIARERFASVARGVGVALASIPHRLRPIRAGRGTRDELERALDQLEGSDTQLTAIFTAGEPVLEELERDDGLERVRSRTNVQVVAIPGPLTSHTLEPLPLQRAVHELLDGALARVLDADAHQQTVMFARAEDASTGWRVPSR